uniref:hypothetical protein n=1 Tax=Mycobacterium avium TaxID=1764 RepID=UPI000A97C738
MAADLTNAARSVSPLRGADGRHGWEYAPRNGETDLAAVAGSAATQVLPDAPLGASEQRAAPRPGARLVTALPRHPGG